MRTDYELNNIDPDDISDVLVKVEKSLDIKFRDTELLHIITFGELCDHIADKIQLDKSIDCTSQQAFYKLRAAISSTVQIDYQVISPGFSLTNILPRKSRRSRIKKLEQYLEFELSVLRPSHWVIGTLRTILLVSFAGLFLNWKIALLGILFSISGLWVAYKIGNELTLKTVGQVAEKMTRENYLQSRRNRKTFNKEEIEKILIACFSKDLNLNKNKLTREAKFV